MESIDTSSSSDTEQRASGVGRGRGCRGDQEVATAHENMNDASSPLPT